MEVKIKIFHQCTFASLVVSFWHLIDCLDPERLTSDIRLYRLRSHQTECKKKKKNALKGQISITYFNHMYHISNKKLNLV